MSVGHGTKIYRAHVASYLDTLQGPQHVVPATYGHGSGMFEGLSLYNSVSITNRLLYRCRQ